MKKLAYLVIGLLLIFIFFVFIENDKSGKNTISPAPQQRVWQIKSVDTMKYSRDLALEKLNDNSFDNVIDSQVKAIKDTKATHIAIGTPYDDKFTPYLKRWVKAARKYELNVWYRGNFAGWEGWFGFPRDITREKHIELTRRFIINNPDLFLDGDIFSPCPECENGGPGDPRHQTTAVEEHRKFLITERNAALEEFKNINKKVTVLDSMNYDVAKLVMDMETAQAMGSVVAIDHYVKTPKNLANDIDQLHQNTGAEIFLGEFGVPIPDIHGKLSEQAQADWIEEALSLIKTKPEVIGLNYWVAFGGSTRVFNDDGTPKPAAEVLKKYFSLTNLD